MKYPKFLSKNDLVGITALSSGVGSDIKEAKIAINHLKEYYKLIITPNVYGKKIVSSNKETRVQEFNNLLNENIKLLMNIRGGDFLYETLEYLDYQKIVNKNIWVEGYSDITNLLYILTTKYDLATIYGFNAKSFDDVKLSEYQLNNFKILNGDLITERSFTSRNYSNKKEFTDKGIIIGGCLDSLRYLIGTKYDETISFLEKYQEYGIIWYFDLFSIGSIDLYLTLLQMKNIGWFKYSKTIIFSNILFPNNELDIPYEELITKALDDKNIVFDADIGHIPPVFTMINGSLGTIDYQNNKLSIKMEFIDENNG